MIKQLDPSDFPGAVDVIRESFATVAKEFGFTKQNFPGYTGFVTTVERLQSHFDRDWWMYGLFDEGKLVGHVALSMDADDLYGLHCLAVQPEYRHKGYGKQLLDACKAKVKELGGGKIALGMLEENTVLKSWYAANGFIHTGIKKFDHMPITVGFMELEVK